MGEFVLEVLERRLADELGDERLLGLARHGVPRVEGRAGGHASDEQVGQPADPLPRRGADGDDLREVREARDLQEAFGERGAPKEVGLRHSRDRRRAAADELGEEPVARADGLVGGKAHDDGVDAGEAVADHVVEPLPQEGAGAVQPGGVDDDDLTVLAVDDGADDAPGRLRAGRGDGHLPADHRIGEGRLAGVGPPDDAGESGPESLGGRESRLGGPGGGGAVIHRLLLLRARVWPQS